MDSLSATDDQYMASTFEADTELIDRRLKRLYPFVDFETTQVPTHWNKDDKCTFMRVSHLNLRFTYPERPGVSASDRKNKLEPGAVRANHPCPLFAGVYYFEIHIKESDGFMGIGLCQKCVKMNRLPGWDPLSYGYHGDDGNFFSASGTGVAYGPTFGKDDVIGCGLNLVKKNIFFTKNGVNLGVAMDQIDSVDELFPTVGLQTANALIDVNFGQLPFQYDIFQDLKSVKTTVSLQVDEMKLPGAKKKNWLNGYIASWLATEGHAKALKIFCEESNTDYKDMDEKHVEERKDLANLVYDKRVGELCEELESKLTNITDVIRPLALDLRTQRFAEKVFAKVTMPPPRLVPSAKNGVAKEGNGCAAHAPGAGSSSSSSISSSINGNAVHHPMIGSGNGTAAVGTNHLSTTHSSAPKGIRVADFFMDPSTAGSSSSSATSLKGGGGIVIGTMSPSRPHKRRSSGAKVMDGDRRDSSASRPPSSDIGPPPRRRSAKAKDVRRKEELDEAMDIDVPVDLLRQVVAIDRPIEIVQNAPDKNGSSSSTINMQLTNEEVSLLLSHAPKVKNRSSRSKSGSARKKGWKVPEIVQEGRSVVRSLTEHEEDIKLRCGYTKAEEEEANRLYGEMLNEGIAIKSEAKALAKKHPSLYKYATKALYSVMYDNGDEMEKTEIFGQERQRYLVHSLNKGLIKMEYGTEMCESKLERLERAVRTQKVNLMKKGCAMAPFIDIEGLMGRDPEKLCRNMKGTVAFYDKNDMRMLERRKVQAEIDEKMKIAREEQEIAAKAHRKKKRKLKRKKLREAREREERERMEGGGGGGEEGEMVEMKKKKKKKKDGHDKPPVLTEEMPMEIEDGPSSSGGVRRQRNPSQQGHVSRKSKSGRKNAERERMLNKDGEGEGEADGEGNHPPGAECPGF